MGRGKKYCQRLRYTVSSARQKTLRATVGCAVNEYLGMRRVEAQLMSLRLSRWILARPCVLAPNQMMSRAHAGRESFGRGEMSKAKMIKLLRLTLTNWTLRNSLASQHCSLACMLRLIEGAQRQRSCPPSN